MQYLCCLWTRTEYSFKKWFQSRTYLLLRFLGLQQGVPVCNGLAWISQHLVPVVPAKSLSIASHPHHTDDLIMTYPVGTHAYCINTSDLTWHDVSYCKLLLITARRAFCNEHLIVSVTRELTHVWTAIKGVFFFLSWHNPWIITTTLFNPCMRADSKENKWDWVSNYYLKNKNTHSLTFNSNVLILSAVCTFLL